MKKNINLILGGLIVVAGAAGFFGGMKYQQTKQSAGFTSFRNFQGGNTAGRQGGQGLAQGNRQVFRPVTGEITAVDDKSITVKMPDGSSKIVILSASTQINKADKAAVSDLKTGTTVAVIGSANSDGSVTAQNIQLNPTNLFRGPASTPMP